MRGRWMRSYLRDHSEHVVAEVIVRREGAVGAVREEADDEAEDELAGRARRDEDRQTAIANAHTHTHTHTHTSTLTS